MTAPPATRCRVCHAEVPAGAPRCPSCSAAQGPLDPCPHCRAQAGASPNHELRFVCDVCGGPRVPRLDRSITYSGRENPLLRKADAARKARAGWRAGAVATGLLLPFQLLVFAALLMIFGASFALVATAFVLIAPVAAFLAYAISRAAARGHDIAPAIDAAWLAVATDVAQQSGGALTVASLAQRLGIEEPQAEELMALLDVNEAIGQGARPRARIAVDPSSVALAAQPTQMAASEPAALAAQPTQMAAAEEAALIEQASAEAEAQRRKGTL